MPFADIGIRVFYEDAGNSEAAEAIFLLHGFTLDSRSWPRANEFLGDNYRLVIPDSRGHGRSEAPSTGYTRDERAEDVVRLADHLNIEQFHVVGLSMGGSTAIGLALNHPGRLLSLTLVSSGAAGFNAGKKLSKIDRMAKDESVEVAKRKWIEWSLAFYNEYKPEVARLLGDMMEEHSGAIWADLMRGKYPKTYDLDRVHEIKLLTLIIAGKLDRIFIPLAEQLAERIEKSRLLLYEQTGHIINLECPDRFYADVELFISASVRHSR